MVPRPFPEAWNPSEQWQGGIGRGRRRRRRKRLSLGVDVVVSFVEGRWNVFGFVAETQAWQEGGRDGVAAPVRIE